MPRPPPPASMASRDEEEEISDAEEDEQDPLAELLKWPSGVPVRFFLDNSLTAEMQTKATKKIAAYGGRTVMLEKQADVILVSEARLSMSLRTKQIYYDTHENPVLRNIFVRPLAFLRTCANMGVFSVSTKKMKQGMPGRPRNNRTRVEYTDEDDDHLSVFLAIRTPRLEDGGRGGNEIYKELEDIVCIPALALICSC